MDNVTEGDGALLAIQDLEVHIPTRRGVVEAVDRVSLTVDRGEVVGVVGESGSGKSMLALGIMRLVPAPGRINGGRILLNGDNLVRKSERELRRIRGNQIAMVFQDPSASLNPVLRVGFQIEEGIAAHRRLSRTVRRNEATDMLRQVRIPAADARARDFPHEFSGGMRQRATIAMAMVNRPALLIADEPTTALDVTVQAQIIDLLATLNRETGTAIILITHNIALVSQFCSRVVVMYAGQVAESGPASQVFENPQHPYTWSLLRSVPSVHERVDTGLSAIRGQPPDLAHKPTGCPFHPRCLFATDRCVVQVPPLVEVGHEHQARCWVLMKNVPNPEQAISEHGLERQ